MYLIYSIHYGAVQPIAVVQDEMRAYRIVRSLQRKAAYQVKRTKRFAPYSEIYAHMRVPVLQGKSNTGNRK